MGQISDRAEQQHSSQKGLPHPGTLIERPMWLIQGWAGSKVVGGRGEAESHSWAEAVMGSFFCIGDFVSGVSAVPLGLSVGCQVLKGKYCFFFFSSPISVNFP